MELLQVVFGILFLIALSRLCFWLKAMVKSIVFISHIFYWALPKESRAKVDEGTKSWRNV